MLGTLKSGPKELPRDVAPDPIAPRLLNAVVATYLIFVVAMMLFDDLLGHARPGF